MPDRKELIEKLRGGLPVPAEVREFLARWLDGKVKYKRGRKPRRSPIVVYSAAIYFRRQLRTLIREQKRLDEKDPYGAALEKLAKRHGMKLGTLKKRLYPSNISAYLREGLDRIMKEP